MGLYATDMHLIRKLWKRNQKIKNLLISRLVKALSRKIKQANKKINNLLISGLVKALVQAPSQVNVPQGAGEVGADYRLPVTLEGHRLLVIPGKEECVIPLQS